MPRKSLLERLFTRSQPVEERPSHAKRLAELEGRLDDIESEIEKLARTVRTWLSRIAKREATAANQALEGQLPPDEAAQGILDANSAAPADPVQHLNKAQLRHAFGAGRIRKLGG